MPRERRWGWGQWGEEEQDQKGQVGVGVAQLGPRASGPKLGSRVAAGEVLGHQVPARGRGQAVLAHDLCFLSAASNGIQKPSC